MGKCIECGRETENHYIYYTADLKDIAISLSTNTTTTKYTYTNFEKHDHFRCSKCCFRSSVIAGGILAMLSISSAIFFVFLQITGKSYQQYGGKIFISVLISLISLFFVTWRYIYIRNDKPDSAESGSITLTAIMKLKSAKEKDGKTYFSIWEYKRLR